MSDDNKREIKLPFPEGHEQRPFVLAWVEKAALDRLTSGDLTFSESVGGLDARPLREHVESCGGASGTQGGCTTISW
jgi:hypothetical protein